MEGLEVLGKGEELALASDEEGSLTVEAADERPPTAPPTATPAIVVVADSPDDVDQGAGASVSPGPGSSSFDLGKPVGAVGAVGAGEVDEVDEEGSLELEGSDDAEDAAWAAVNFDDEADGEPDGEMRADAGVGDDAPPERKSQVGEGEAVEAVDEEREWDLGGLSGVDVMGEEDVPPAPAAEEGEDEGDEPPTLAATPPATASPRPAAAAAPSRSSEVEEVEPWEPSLGDESEAEDRVMAGLTADDSWAGLSILDGPSESEPNVWLEIAASEMAAAAEEAAPTPASDAELDALARGDAALHDAPLPGLTGAEDDSPLTGDRRPTATSPAAAPPRSRPSPLTDPLPLKPTRGTQPDALNDDALAADAQLPPDDDDPLTPRRPLCPHPPPPPQAGPQADPPPR